VQESGLGGAERRLKVQWRRGCEKT
jgi:hypothetical protein